MNRNLTTLSGVPAWTTDIEFAEHVPEAPAAEPDLRQRLYAAIDALPDIYRSVFVLHHIEGYTHEEIAEALGVTPGTSKAQLSRGRAKLRLALAEFAEEWRA